MSQPSPTVFVVDDDPSVRRSLARLLKSAGHRGEVFASAHEFLASGRHCDATGCVVLDIEMPGLSGLDLQQELSKSPPVLPIIFITGHGDIPTGIKAMKNGAVDFLPKPFQDQDLLQAIGLAFERSRHERAEYAVRHLIGQRVATLTTREREVMELVVTGRMNKQIAVVLDTTEKTIKVHRGRVMEKMAVKSVAELVRDAGKVGIPARPR